MIKTSVRVVSNRLVPLGKAIRSSVEAERKAEAAEFAEIARAEAPVRTGELRAGIVVTEQGDKTSLVEARAPYSGYVNNGTRKMPANPFWDRARKRVEGKHTDRHVKAVKRAVG